MRCRPCQPLPEEVARAADLLGRRWALAILWAAAEAGAVRFNEFKQTLEGIPPRTLAARLTELEEAGGLERRGVALAAPPGRASPGGRGERPPPLGGTREALPAPARGRGHPARPPAR